jgi:hypothetical protein
MSQDSSGEAAHGSSRSSLPRRSRDRLQSRGGRGHNRGKSVREQTFEGRVPELKGAVYDLTIERNPDQYLETTKGIITFMASRCTSYTTELIEGLQELQITDPQAPTDPDPTDPIAVEKWEIALRQHENRVQVFKNFRNILPEVKRAKALNKEIMDQSEVIDAEAMDELGSLASGELVHDFFVECLSSLDFWSNVGIASWNASLVQLRELPLDRSFISLWAAVIFEQIKRIHHCIPGSLTNYWYVLRDTVQ